MKKILIFSGAGLDKESGIETFRDSENALWNNYKVEDVATIDGWRRNKELVLDFYNQRRAQLKDVEPNLAHKIIADLEKDYDVTVITQNVTDLQERAGSTKVVHLHGELLKSKSTFPGSTETYDCFGDIKIGDKCPKGAQIRPAIVWFGEDLDTSNLEKAMTSAKECDICIIVGTSMQVAPANLIPLLVKDNTPVYYVDPGENSNVSSNCIHIKDIASIGMEKLVNILKNS